MRRILLISALIVSWVSFAAFSAADEPEFEAALRVLLKMRSPENEKQLVKVFNRAKADPQFRTRLVNVLTDRLAAYRKDYQGDAEIRALRELEAVEVLPELLERWADTAKKTYYLDWADPRVQLLKTIAQFLTEEQRVQFLIDAEQDEQEAPRVRFRATLLLCASGNKRAVQHVLSVYEESKRKHPRTTRASLEDQNKYLRKKTDWDQDADMMTDYAERGMLLDPSKADTDGDGIVDGNDRNPLCARAKTKTELQEIAQFLFYLHARYRRHTPRSPFPFQVWIVRTVDNYDGKGLPSVLKGVELTGIDATVLHMTREQGKNYHSIHGWGTPVLNIHEFRGAGKAEKEVWLSEFAGPGQWAGWKIRLKRIHDVWLPVEWKLEIMT